MKSKTRIQKEKENREVYEAAINIINSWPAWKQDLVEEAPMSKWIRKNRGFGVKPKWVYADDETIQLIPCISDLVFDRYVLEIGDKSINFESPSLREAKQYVNKCLDRLVQQ